MVQDRGVTIERVECHQIAVI